VDTAYVNEAQRECLVVRWGAGGTDTGYEVPASFPLDLCAVDNTARTVRVPREKDTVENSPSSRTSQEMTPDYEAQDRSYYRL